MEQVIQIVSVLIVLRTLLALSLFPYVWQRLLFAGVSACCIWILYPMAIEQSNSFLHQVFADKADYRNGGGLLILEGIGLMAIRGLQLQDHFNASDGWWSRHPGLVHCLLFVPGLSYFAVLFYGEVQLFLLVDQFPFEQLTFVYALLVLVGTSWLPSLFGHLLSERDLRIEVDCFLLALQLVLAMVLTALPSIREYTHPAIGSKGSWPALLGWLGLLLFGIVLGYLQYWRKIRKKSLRATQERTTKIYE